MIDLTVHEIRICSGSLIYVSNGHFAKTQRPSFPELGGIGLDEIHDKIYQSWKRAYDKASPLHSYGEKGFDEAWASFRRAPSDLLLDKTELEVVSKCVNCVLNELRGDLIEIRVLIECEEIELAAFNHRLKQYL